MISARQQKLCAHADQRDQEPYFTEGKKKEKNNQALTGEKRDPASKKVNIFKKTIKYPDRIVCEKINKSRLWYLRAGEGRQTV